MSRPKKKVPTVYNYRNISFIQTGQGDRVWTENHEAHGQFEIVDRVDFVTFKKVAKQLGYNLVDRQFDA